MCGKCSHCFSCTGFAPAPGLCAFIVYTSQALGCSSRNCLRRALGRLHFPGLNCSGWGSWVLQKCTDSVGLAFCTLPRSEQLRWPGAWWVQTPPVGSWVLSSPLSQPLGFLGVQWAHLLRCAVCLFWGADLWLRPPPPKLMSTNLNPKKSWLAMTPACTLVEDASPETQLPPSGSSCPHLPVSGGEWSGPQPASFAQSFVLCVGLVVS